MYPLLSGLYSRIIYETLILQTKAINIVLNSFTSDSLMTLCLGIHILHVVLVLQTLFGETETLQTQTLDILLSEFNMGQLFVATALGLCWTKRHRL